MKKSSTRLDAAPFVYAIHQCPLRDLNGLGDFLLRFGLRHRDGQDAVLYLGRDLVLQNVIRQVNQRAFQSAIVLVVLLLLIALMIWALVSFGSYLYSMVSSIF